jgi:signal transduction histidine kinase
MLRLLYFSATLLGGILLLLAGLNLYVYVDLRDAAIREATADLERQAEIRGQEIESSLQSIRFALERIELLWTFDNGSGAWMHDQLKGLEQQLGYVRALSIVSTTGDGLHSSRVHPVPPVNVADLPVVAYHMAGGAEKFRLGMPTRSTIDDEWQLPLSMAVRDADGRLSAIIIAVIDPKAYSKAFERAVAAGDYVTLLTRDLHLVARTPWLEEETGRSLARTTAYQALDLSGLPAISGVYENPFTGRSRIAAVRRIFDDRLVISSSRSLEAGIAGWRSLAQIISVISGLILLAAAAAIYVAIRMLRDRDRRAQTLARLNHDLQEQTARAERLATVKSEFLATMSHEIRTPMNGVLGMAQALETLPLDPLARDYVGVIRESADGLLGIINDILDFSRLEAGRLKVAPSTVRLPALLDSLTALFAPACAQKNLALRTEMAPATPGTIETDPARLRQILINLVGNAVKFTAQGGITLRLQPVLLRDGADGVRIAVEDTGIGIAPAALDGIFERFTQEDASTARQYGGTGLGLAICRRLVGLLGGEIGCCSEKGAGSVFWVDLPLDLPDEDVMTDAAPVVRRSIATAPHVLCVDDNHINRRIIETLLQPFCRKLTLAASGAEALALIAVTRFDAVLLDIHMPDMDGIETYHRLRRLPNGRDAPVVALTADVVPEALARYEMAGFDEVVAKPVELDHLLRALGLQRQ